MSDNTDVRSTQRVIVLFVLGLVLAGVYSLAVGDDPAPDYKSLDREVLEILARNQAKALAEAQGRIDALVQEVAALTGERDQLASDAERLKGELAEAVATAAYYKKFVESDPEAAARLEEHEAEQGRQAKIDEAIKEKRLVVGMTLDQARQAMEGNREQIVEQNAGIDTYMWERYTERQVAKSINGSYTKGSVYMSHETVLSATFYADVSQKGIVTRVWKY